VIGMVHVSPLGSTAPELADEDCATQQLMRRSERRKGK